jgi:hypothetical protein
MDEIFLAGETNDGISIERCRERLGDEAIDLTDDEIDRIRICADTVAQAVIGIFLERATTDDPLAHDQEVAASRRQVYAAGHGRRSDLRARQHQGAD